MVSQCRIWAPLFLCWIPQLFILSLVPRFCYWFRFCLTSLVESDHSFSCFLVLFCTSILYWAVGKCGHKKKNHGVEHRHRPYKPMTCLSQPHRLMSLLFLPDRHTFGQTSLRVTSKTGWGSPFLLIFCSESLPLIKREFTLIFHLPRGTDCWVCVQRGLETWREQTSLLTNHCQLSWGHQSLKPLLLWEKMAASYVYFYYNPNTGA